MSETFKSLSARIGQVGELYARAHGIDRSPDWYLLKLTEELGELTAEHLLLQGRARRRFQLSPDPIGALPCRGPATNMQPTVNPR